jgi:hypothetical protein
LERSWLSFGFDWVGLCPVTRDFEIDAAEIPADGGKHRAESIFFRAECVVEDGSYHVDGWRRGALTAAVRT